MRLVGELRRGIESRRAAVGERWGTESALIMARGNDSDSVNLGSNPGPPQFLRAHLGFFAGLPKYPLAA
jgi:hypothetical protein